MTFTLTCALCDAPMTDGVRGVLPGGERYVHPACYRAWAYDDTEALARLRKEACEAGHHRFPGRWTPDPADPYGDAQYWECAKGCGHVQQHPGYGHGRMVTEMLARREGEGR